MLDSKRIIPEYIINEANPDVIFEYLENILTNYEFKVNIIKIKDAYVFARKAHYGQIRKSGLEYIVHPLLTALNITRINGDEDSIIACILHDVPEDTEYTVKDIDKKFGKDVAFIVDGVTKLSKVKYKNNMKNFQVDSLRKLLLSTTKDARVITVKICDRMHNVSTLEYLRKDKAKRIAKETLEIYYPILHLMSLGMFMKDMIDTCFKYVYPEDFKKITKFLKDNYSNHNEIIEKVSKKLNKPLNKVGIKDYKLESRIKSMYSIYKKINIRGVSLENITDIIAFRIVVHSKIKCYKALGVIHSLFKIKTDKFKDYISAPKHNGYQSIHTTVYDRSGNLVEFIIEDNKMYELNNYGIASYIKYKKWNNTNSLPDWIKKIINIEDDLQIDDNFLEKIKGEIFVDNIFCFTPQGKQIELPVGSTILDFAYSINSNLGNKIKYAYINGKRAKNILKEVNQLDTIKIVTGKDKNEYGVDILKNVKTINAKNHIKKLLQIKSKTEQLELGKYLLDNKLNILGFNKFDFLDKSTINSVLELINIQNIETLYKNIGSGKIRVSKIVKAVSKEIGFNNIKHTVYLLIYKKIKKDTSFSKHILDILDKLGIELIFIHSKKISYIKIGIYVKNMSEFQKLITELDRAPNVLLIKRIQSFSIKIFYYIITIFFIFMLLLPVYLWFFIIDNNIYSLEIKSVIVNSIMYSSVTIIGIIFIFFRYLSDITLSGFFNPKYVWIIIYVINILLISIAIWESVYKALNFNTIAFMGVLFILFGMIIFEKINSSRIILSNK